MTPSQKRILCAVFLSVSVCAVVCGTIFFRGKSDTVIPHESLPLDRPPSLRPDYAQTTLPPNLAPIRFTIREEGTDFVTRITGADGTQRLIAGREVLIPESDWRTLCEKSTGGKIIFEVYVCGEGESWSRFAPFEVTISADSISPWIAYRLIEPGYEHYGRMTLNQRSLETYTEEPFFNSGAAGKSVCVNCHHFQNGNPDRFLFHTRVEHPGTTLVQDGALSQKNFKIGPLGLSPVYPAWHPTLPLVVFSCNRTRQYFFYDDPDKVEVLDSYSDLALYEPETESCRPLRETEFDLETFPSWSPDGTTLFYASAFFDAEPLSREDLESSMEKRQNEIGRRFRELKYNIIALAFDAEKRSFGEPQTLVDAAADGKSALHPRLAPDGRYLIYTLCDYGTFPIWHRESDLAMLDRETGTHRLLTELNSTEAESYPVWDFSGRWLMFASRREDGATTRIYFAHFNGDGTFGKPFQLPTRSPEADFERVYSYNVPEFLTRPITLPAGKLERSVR